MARPRKSLVLARELAEDPKVSLQKHHENPHVLRRLCKIADERTSTGDGSGLPVARLCCRLAGRLKTDEAFAQSFARLATSLRAAGRLDHAEEALRVGLAVAPPHLEGDLLRRRAMVRTYRESFDLALKDAKSAVELTTGAVHAKALGVLGIVHFYRGENREAIRVLAECLARTDPSSGYLYCAAIQNYAGALSKGTDAEAVKALELCGELRPKLKYPHKMQRARLWWTEGLLHHRLGDSRQAWRSLNHARLSLAALQAAPELAALVADMATVSPQQPAVQVICDEAADVVVAQRSLAKPLRALADAAREMIPEAARALREAAGRLAPCPAL